MDRPWWQLHTTIIISTRNRVDLLQNCIDSILPAVERAAADILIVDNETSDENTLRYLANIDDRYATILRLAGDFNRPRLNNHGVLAARGEAVFLLDSNVTATDDRWLDEMLGRTIDSDVGAVGPLLIWSSGMVRSGGTVLGPGFS